MKKLSVLLFIIGMFVFLVDADNMIIFFTTKVIGLIFMIPAFITIMSE